MRPGDVRKRIWREARKPVDVRMPDGTVHHIEPGVFVEEAIFRYVNRERAVIFGPTYDDSLLARVFGFAVPEPGQILLDGRTEPRRMKQMQQFDRGPSKAERPPVQVIGPEQSRQDPDAPAKPRDILPLAPGVVGWCQIGKTVLDFSLPTGYKAAVFVSEWPDRASTMRDPVEFPDAAVSECLRCMDETGALGVIPISNIGHPIAAPTGKDETRSAAMRLPGGRSPKTIATALLAARPAYTRLISSDFGAIVVRQDAIADYLAGNLPADRVVTCLTAFAWRRPGAPALPPLKGEPALCGESPAVLVHPIREAVAKVRNPGLPVVFVCDGVGPVGGTQVLLNLVDALNDRGDICASIVHEFRGSYAHRFRSRTPVVPLTRAEIVNAIEDRLGWKRGERGIVVATSWGTGEKVRDICARRPHLIPAAFWQDREDLFERPDGSRASADEFRAYLDIPRAVSVSRWVAETARTEAGAKASAVVINPAVDPDSGAWIPRPHPGDGGPVRVLAMWRPMTAVRRGMPRLAALYAALRERYKGRVSLELFGWPECAPPAVDVHHGLLDTMGVSALMREVDIVVEPSDYQGFGLTGLEAMSGGACLVSTACRGVDEYARHEKNALVVPHGELENAVRRAIEDIALRARLQLAGHATAGEDERQWSGVAAAWSRTLKSWAASADKG